MGIGVDIPHTIGRIDGLQKRVRKTARAGLRGWVQNGPLISHLNGVMMIEPPKRNGLTGGTTQQLVEVTLLPFHVLLLAALDLRMLRDDLHGCRVSTVPALECRGEFLLSCRHWIPRLN